MPGVSLPHWIIQISTHKQNNWWLQGATPPAHKYPGNASPTQAPNISNSKHNSARSWDQFLISQLCKLPARRLLTGQWHKWESLWEQQELPLLRLYSKPSRDGKVKAEQESVRKKWEGWASNREQHGVISECFTLFLFFFEWICIINSKSIFHSTCKASCVKSTYIYTYIVTARYTQEGSKSQRVRKALLNNCMVTLELKSAHRLC